MGSVKNLGQAILYFKGDTGHLDKKLGNVGKNVGAIVKKVGRAMTVVGGAITGALALTVSKSNELSAALAKVSTLGVENLEKLRQGAHDIAKEFGLNAVDAVNEFYQLLSAEIPEPAAYAVLRENARGAVAGVGSLTSAVNLGTSAMSAYGLKTGTAAEITDNMARVMGIAATAVKRGKTTFDAMNQGIGRTIDSAAAVGITLEEVFVTIARGTASGKQAGEVWTSLNAAITNINKPSKEAAELAKALGIEFNAAALQTKGWSKFLGEMRSAVEKNNAALYARKKAIEKEIAAMEARGKLSAKEKARLKELKDELKSLAGVGEVAISTMGKLFGSSEALGLVLSITGDKAADFESVIADMANAQETLNEMFEAGIENDPTLQWRQLKAELAELSDLIGLTLVPALTKLLQEHIIPLVKKVKEWIEENKPLFESIVKWTAVIGALMVVLGPLLIMLPGIATAVGAVTAAFGLVSAPVLLVIGILAALALAIVLVIKNWDTLGPKVKKVWDAVVKFVKDGWTKVKNWFKKSISFLMTLWQRFWASDIGVFLQMIWERLAGIVSNGWNYIENAIVDGLAVLLPKWKAGWNDLKTWLEVDFFPGLIGFLNRQFDAIGGLFQGFFQDLFDMLSDWFPGSDWLAMMAGRGTPGLAGPGSTVGAQFPGGGMQVPGGGMQVPAGAGGAGGGGGGLPAYVPGPQYGGPPVNHINVNMTVEGNVVTDDDFTRELAAGIAEQIHLGMA